MSPRRYSTTRPRSTYVRTAVGLQSHLVLIWMVVLAAAPLLYRVPGVESGLTHTPATVELGTAAVNAGSIAGPGVDTLPEALGVSYGRL
jgi:hypothetical protein